MGLLAPLTHTLGARSDLDSCAARSAPSRSDALTSSVNEIFLYNFKLSLISFLVLNVEHVL